MLTLDYLSRLSDRELLTVLHAERDSLTVTPAELALHARLEAIVDSKLPKLTAKFEEHGVDDDDVGELLDAVILGVPNTVELLEVVNEAGIDSADELKRALEFHRSFHSLAEDAGEIFTRPAAFLQPTNQES